MHIPKTGERVYVNEYEAILQSPIHTMRLKRQIYCLSGVGQ